MVSYKRHIAKTLSWRVIGTIDTMVLSALSYWKLGDGINHGGGIEVVTKMVLYFLPRKVMVSFL